MKTRRVMIYGSLSLLIILTICILYIIDSTYRNNISLTITPMDEDVTKYTSPEAVPDLSTVVTAAYESEGRLLIVTFNTTENTVTFTHSTTGNVTLPQAMSGSGARYATADESIVFWEHQGEGSLTINGLEVFKGPINPTAPLREAYDGCTWERTKGAGLELWGQSCDFSDQKLRIAASETLPGIFLENITNESPIASEMLIRVFPITSGVIDEVLSILSLEENWREAEGCRFTMDDSTRGDVTRYILQPTGDALQAFTDLAAQEPIVSTCAGYGLGNSGIRYFEIHDSNPEKALFIEIGQEAPLFDEETIQVQ